MYFLWSVFIILWHLLLFIPVTLLLVLVLVPSIPDPQLLMFASAEEGDSNVIPLGGENLILVQISVTPVTGEFILLIRDFMPHTFQCQIQTSEMHIFLVGPNLFSLLLFLVFSHFSMDFFFFNAWRDKYCAQFHQAVTGVRKLPTF